MSHPQQKHYHMINLPFLIPILRHVIKNYHPPDLPSTLLITLLYAQPLVEINLLFITPFL